MKQKGRPARHKQKKGSAPTRPGSPAKKMSVPASHSSAPKTKTPKREELRRGTRHERREVRANLRAEQKEFSPPRRGGKPNKSRDNRDRQAEEPRRSAAPAASSPMQARDPVRVPPPSSKVSSASLVGKVIQGRVDIHPDGFGFFISKDPTIPNVYVPESSLKTLMHRDEVMLKVDRAFENGGKLSGSVVSIVRRAQKEFLGVYRPYKGGALIVPTEVRDRKHAFRLDGTLPAALDGLKAGAAVLCRIVQYPDRGQGLAQIEMVVEDPSAPSHDTMRVLIEAGWPREFSRAALSEAEMRAHGWQSRTKSRRKDIRSLPLVTIDGRDARDFDDAVCAQKEGANIRLWVAIADVSMFVQPGTALDEEAFERSTSVYFPDHVVPMLPEVLSNGVCSLNPNEDRACMVCEMVIDAGGHCVDYEIYEGLMFSKKRLTYEDMQAFIEKQTWAVDEMAPLAESLEQLIEVFRRLNRARMRRGAIDLELPEAKVLMNQDGTIMDIQSRERLDAHRLIEECMLIANQCTARFLEDRGEGVYRIHEAPDDLKVADLMRFLSTTGFQVNDLEEPGDFADLLARVKKELGADDPTARAISTLVLRSLKQARYSSAAIGHFALAAKDYTHFTSPIRRYPDLLVHRLLKVALYKDGFAPPRGMDLESAARHCSDQERLAMDCERKLIDIKKCRYMEPRVGEEFDAWVSGVVEKGLFCQIDGHYVDGLISADAVWKAVKHKFDPEQMAYVGPGKSKIGLGTRVRVLLAGVDVITRRIDFGLVEVQSA